jgi:adenylate cyclase
MITLVYGLSDQSQPVRHDLRVGASLVGRGQGADIVLNDESVSRRHAQLAVVGDACEVMDLGSYNGTYVNDVQIVHQRLRDGDRIAFGRVRGRIEVSKADNLIVTEDSAVEPFEQTIVAIPGKLSQGSTVSQAELLRVLSELSRTCLELPPLNTLLEQIVDLTLKLIPAERAFLVLRDPHTEALVPKVVRGVKDQAASPPAISKTVAKRVIEERVALLSSDVSQDPALADAPSIHIQRIRSFMCAPLWSGSRVVGLLYLDSKNFRPFTQADLELFGIFANQAAVGIEQTTLTQNLQEQVRARERLARYHSPSVVDRIVQQHETDTALMIQEREVTVLFADIVGFTPMSQKLTPARVAALLNEYFGAMTEAVFAYDGTLDKFIGDAILAVFGAPMDQPDHAIRAVRAAAQMRRALVEFNAKRNSDRVENRIAVHTGVAVAGDIGTPARREYTVLGDVVNTASRIQSSVAKPGQILVTRATLDRLGETTWARPFGAFQLRGRTGEVEVFEVDPALVT